MVDRGRHEDGAVRACGAVRGVADQVASICSVYLPDRDRIVALPARMRLLEMSMEVTTLRF